MPLTPCIHHPIVASTCCMCHFAVPSSLYVPHHCSSPTTDLACTCHVAVHPTVSCATSPSPSPPPAPCGQRFGDVPAADPACVAIEALAARGVIKGCDQAATPPLFCPLQPTLRAQMAALIVRAMGWGSETPANPFSDKCDPIVPANCVDDELWNSVGVLAGKDVAKGYTDSATCAPATAPCYAPRDFVLHAQVLSFITRAMVAATNSVMPPV